ncbi:MAG TPA: ATP-binding protein [Acidimicrobiia bacterium]|nr:ATP-binding protein [Acidimicrobiia bacterium]
MTVKVDSSVHAPQLSRSQLAPMRPALGRRYDDVVLVVSELVSNSVRHGASEGIDVKVTNRNGRVRVEVTDDGPGFDASAPRGEGLGLTIVERLADRWGMQDSGQRFTVWAELAIEGVA